jgi:SH3-like domain-containing protein
MTRRIFFGKGSIVLATAVLVFLVSTGFGVAAEFGSIKKDGVNIRSGPSTKNDVLWEVFKGYPVEILKREGDWALVRDFENDKGWIYSNLLSDNRTMIVTVETANMRSGPDKDDKIVATVKKGVVFTPLEQRGNWIKLQYKKDITGWMYNTLLFPANL